ncbi:MAG: hypothetical protein PVG30_09120 [Gammaproteobacteria bacterium]|jgi:hypothetical protein
MINTKLHYPPYGKVLAEQLIKGELPQNDVFLFLGENAWKHAKYYHFTGQTVLILPENEYPEKFIWPVTNLPILVFDMNSYCTNEKFLKRLAYQLLNSGAKCVRITSAFEHYPMVVFKTGLTGLK